MDVIHIVKFEFGYIIIEFTLRDHYFVARYYKKHTITSAVKLITKLYQKSIATLAEKELHQKITKLLQAVCIQQSYTHLL